jgi:hypothetical protein
MTEKFGLDETWRNRRTIYWNEWPLFAGPAEVDLARYQFFSRAALPEDQHGVVLRGQFFDSALDAIHLG